ncbi:MAG TPA: amino acid permease [Syntrophomonadaceae bacterium]|nr:amino acid permease [Syntrophomonadaceae bacterium]HPR94267.1 amino acid permease [Syntrophomonadaceae bacterium]
MNKSGLNASQLTMLTLGTVIGGSFFLGSAIAIKAAGPSIILGFIFGGALVYIILNALSEMTVANPCPGSFRTHAVEAYGPFLGFIVGWVYWSGLILAMSSEATAAALLIKAWFPYLSLPLLSITIVAGITLINLLGAGLVTKLENTLAAVKILAVLMFIVIAVVLIFGLLPARAPVGLGELQNSVFFPNGIGGLAGSMLLVLLAYAGFEIIGLAASEARDPHMNIPRAIKASVISLLGLYITVTALMLPLISTGSLSASTSPMVATLSAHGLGVAAGTVNFVLVTAILSTMLASVFGLGRMLRSLADGGDAPAFLIDRGDVPLKGILFSGIAMLLGVSMAFVLPNRIYLFLVSSAGFSLLLTYLVIMLTHLSFRTRFGCPPKGNCQLAGYPYTTWAAIISLVIVIVTMPLISGQGSGLFAGLVLLVLYSAAYFIFRAAPLQSAPAAKPFAGDNNNQACSFRKFRLRGFSARKQKQKQPPDSSE